MVKTRSGLDTAVAGRAVAPPKAMPPTVRETTLGDLPNELLVLIAGRVGNVEHITALIGRFINTYEDWRVVRASMNERWEDINTHNKTVLDVGDTVQLRCRGRAVIGKVQKINRKTIDVVSGFSTYRWPAAQVKLISKA